MPLRRLAAATAAAEAADLADLAELAEYAEEIAQYNNKTAKVAPPAAAQPELYSHPTSFSTSSSLSTSQYASPLSPYDESLETPNKTLHSSSIPVQIGEIEPPHHIPLDAKQLKSKGRGKKILIGAAVLAAILLIHSNVLKRAYDKFSDFARRRIEDRINRRLRLLEGGFETSATPYGGRSEHTGGYERSAYNPADYEVGRYDGGRPSAPPQSEVDQFSTSGAYDYNRESPGYYDRGYPD